MTGYACVWTRRRSCRYALHRPKRIKDKIRPVGCLWRGVGVAAPSARRGASSVLVGLLAAACTLALAGCNPDTQGVSAAQPRGATVAFNSLDGLPPGQFQKLVRDLNEEAQARHLAVISREQSSAYRVRGYLAIKVTKHQTTVSWVWDVFDQEENRTLRISGEETAKVGTAMHGQRPTTRCCNGSRVPVWKSLPRS